MKLNIKNTNVEVMDGVTLYLEKKLMLLDKIIDFSRDDVYVNAELGKISQHHKGGDIFRAEVNLFIGGRDYRAVAENSDMYAAIDYVKDEIAREVKTGKEKRQSIFRRSAKKLKNIIRYPWMKYRKWRE